MWPAKGSQRYVPFTRTLYRNTLIASGRRRLVQRSHEKGVDEAEVSAAPNALAQARKSGPIPYPSPVSFVDGDVDYDGSCGLIQSRQSTAKLDILLQLVPNLRADLVVDGPAALELTLRFAQQLSQVQLVDPPAVLLPCLQKRRCAPVARNA